MNDFSGYITKTSLILPFKDEWEAYNGGKDPNKNNHIKNTPNKYSQSFAYDFIRGHQGEGLNLENYQAFGQEVISPADGEIIQVINGAFDMPIGSRDRYIITGNLILIDHKNGEYSALAHFKNGSILVSVGDKVKQGQVLGLCGNSGNTSEPHIHYHLQDSGDISDANGLPAFFKKIEVDGEIKENVEPERGQKVSNI